MQQEHTPPDTTRVAELETQRDELAAQVTEAEHQLSACITDGGDVVAAQRQLAQRRADLAGFDEVLATAHAAQAIAAGGATRAAAIDRLRELVQERAAQVAEARQHVEALVEAITVHLPPLRRYTPHHRNLQSQAIEQLRLLGCVLKPSPVMTQKDVDQDHALLADLTEQLQLDLLLGLIGDGLPEHHAAYNYKGPALIPQGDVGALIVRLLAAPKTRPGELVTTGERPPPAPAPASGGASENSATAAYFRQTYGQGGE